MMSDDTPSALLGTVTPYNDTNGVSPATDPMTPTGETLRYHRPISSSQFAGTEEFATRGCGGDSHASTATEHFDAQTPGDLVERLLPFS